MAERRALARWFVLWRHSRGRPPKYFLNVAFPCGQSFSCGRFAMGRIRDDRCSFVCGLQECGGDIEYKPNRFAIAAVDLGGVRTLQQFQVSISQRPLPLLPIPGIVQATLREYYDSIQHVCALATCPIPLPFPFTTHTQP